MIYADYEYYMMNYMGRLIQEDDFPRLALRASRYIDHITVNKAQKNADMEAVKMCCCALAELEQQIETAQELSQKSLSAETVDGAEVQSESVGGWSRSYRAGGSSAQAAVEAAASMKSERMSIVREYLTQTGLLYRGGGCCRR